MMKHRMHHYDAANKNKNMKSTWNFTPINEKTNDIMQDSHYDCQLGETIESVRQQIELMTTLGDCMSAGFIQKNINPIESGLIGQLQFSKVTRSSIPDLLQFFNTFNSRSCDYSIGGILMWTDYFKYEIAFLNSTLFIKGYDKESDLFLYYSPLGIMDKNEALTLIEKDAAYNGNKAVLISDIETKFDNQVINISETHEYCDKWMEYLYDIEKFLHFSGKKMEKKRNHLNYFLKHYPDYRIEAITTGNTAELIDFTKRFEKTHIDSDLFNYESRQTLEVLKQYDSFPFEGLLIRINGNVVGYSFGEKIGDTFFVHVEKGDISFQGVYQMLASSLAQYVNDKHPEVKYLNREEDMGNEALRKSKESYHPSLLINKRIQVLNRELVKEPQAETKIG